jgi:hypothetical protein
MLTDYEKREFSLTVIAPIPAPAPPEVIITPEVMEAVKIRLVAQKEEEQKQKKRDYQREYMRTYKKDAPPSADDQAKARLKRTLKKYDTELIKEVLKGL